MKSNKILATVAAVAAMLAVPLAAQAAPQFAAKISDGINTITIFDNGAGDGSSTVGTIGFMGFGVFGNWDVSFVVGTSTFDPLAMHISAGYSAATANFGSGESKVLTISISQTGLSSGAGTNNVTFGAFGGGSGLSSGNPATSWAAYADDTDALFGTATTVLSSNQFATVSGGVNATMTDLYSATLVASFDLSSVTGPTSAASQDLSMNVPEPGTIALAGLGLLALGAARRRKA